MISGRMAAAALAAALSTTSAHAVIGGREEAGPLARSSVMVLGSSGGMCSAVVVARDVVLTAAHCVAGASQHRVHWRDEAGEPVLVAPAAVAIHAGYEAQAVKTRRRSIDLALVRLPEPLPARFTPATLAAASAGAGAGVTLGGWGLAAEGQSRTTGTFRSARLAVVEPYGPSRILIWLASADRRGAVGGCQGDSGGPIALAGGADVFALTSWATGAKGRACGDLTQGVLLGPQRGWIDEAMSRWGRAATWSR
jgi:hypothetical protein